MLLANSQGPIGSGGLLNHRRRYYTVILKRSVCNATQFRWKNENRTRGLNSTIVAPNEIHAIVENMYVYANNTVFLDFLFISIEDSR